MVDIPGSTPRDPLPQTASEYLAANVYPTLEPALEAMLQAAFPERETPEGEEEQPLGDVRPLKWLASYLKERNQTNSLKRDATTWEAALQRLMIETETVEGVFGNGVTAARNVFWPCSATVALKDVEIVETPAEPEPPAEGEGEEEEAAAEEEGGEKPPPPMIRTEVPILRFVATSHPDRRSIEGRALRWEEEGVTGRAVRSGEALLVPHVGMEPGMHFFGGVGGAARGSYCAVPLKEETGEVYGVLCVDTLLDGREMTLGQLAYLKEIAKGIDAAREPYARKERDAKAERERLAKEAREAEEEAKRAEEEEAERLRQEEEGGEEDAAS